MEGWADVASFRKASPAPRQPAGVSFRGPDVVEPLVWSNGPRMIETSITVQQGEGGLLQSTLRTCITRLQFAHGHLSATHPAVGNIDTMLETVDVALLVDAYWLPSEAELGGSDGSS